MNELNKLYSAMLRSWNGVIKDDGKILFTSGGVEYPIRIDEMDMYLPLSNVLENNCMDKVFFHPACENIISKETEVFKIIRKMTCMKLLEVFRLMPMVLFGIASGEKPKKAWRQETIDMMEPLKAAKSPVRKELSALFARMHIELEEDGLDNRFLHFKVSKGGGRSKGTGERVYYKTKPQFPFYNEMVKRLARSEGQADNQTVELNNYSVSRAAMKLAVHLFQCVLPAVLAPDEYEFESLVPTAARLVSYLGCYEMIADQMNKTQNQFRGDFDKAGIYNIDLNWVEFLEDLPETYRQVPIMDYNSHNTQDEAVQGRNDLGGLMSLSSNQNNNQNYNNGNQNNNNQNNGNNNNGNNNGNNNVMVGDYDLTAPVMQNGDRYIRAEIDHNNGQVLHHAQSQSGQPVLYYCTRRGNYLQRAEINNMNNGMGNMMNTNNMMNPMMAAMMGINPMMAAMMGTNMNNRPVTANQPIVSVYPDNGGVQAGVW